MKYFTVKKQENYPIICHIPHGSNSIPKKYRKDFLLSGKDLEIEAQTMGDLYAKELYGPLFKRFGGIASDVSRIAVDMERFEKDRDEPMSKAGMGVLYTITSAGKALRRIDKRRREEYLEEIFRPYHRAFAGLVRECLKKFGTCLILDCHSFPSAPRQYEEDKKKNRPDFCLGTDKLHTPAILKRIFSKAIKGEDYSLKFDSPFKGTIVPLPFYRNKKVFSVLIETNRRLYMDEKTFAKRKNFHKLSRTIDGMAHRASIEFFKSIL